MKRVFAPGCALMLYKPHLAEKLSRILIENCGVQDQLLTCCKHDPAVGMGTEVINICPGCDKRFGNDYPQTSTVSLWEVLAEAEFFPFPDYAGRQMAVLDACPTREKPSVHRAVRTLLNRMNIRVAEPEKTGTRSVCCGDSFYGTIPVEKVKVQMYKRAQEMPAEEVAVYCVSCVKSMHIGGRRPRYLVDLLFGEETQPGIYEPDEWHQMLDDYILKH